MQAIRPAKAPDRWPQGNAEGTRAPGGRRLTVLAIGLSEELMNVAVDVIADLAHAFERKVLGIVEDPADPAGARV